MLGRSLIPLFAGRLGRRLGRLDPDGMLPLDSVDGAWDGKLLEVGAVVRRLGVFPTNGPRVIISDGVGDGPRVVIADGFVDGPNVGAMVEGDIRLCR
jgi:hypothetical protein